MFVVAAFYKFTTLDACHTIKAHLTELMGNQISGTILLAHEGINGTVCGSREGIDALHSYFMSHDSLRGLTYKESFADKNPFLRRHIKIKPEIVTLGQPIADPRKKTGTHVNAQQWHTLLEDPSVVVLDVRNKYETALGMFKNAIDPQTETFKDFPIYVKNHLDPKIHKRIAMSCTGGIRCEKASAYLLSSGFEQVYQLDGGVLQYLEDTPKEQSEWQGECFVFDHRVSVDHELKVGSYTMCFGCRMPLSVDDKTRPEYVADVKCHHCDKYTSQQKQQAKKMRGQQIARAQRRGNHHLGNGAMSAHKQTA